MSTVSFRPLCCGLILLLLFWTPAWSSTSSDVHLAQGEQETSKTAQRQEEESAQATTGDEESSSGEPQAQFTEAVTVTGTREERSVTEVPAAVAVLGEEVLRAGRGEGLDSYLGSIPGVVAQPNDGGSDVKLAIRGFGARSGFGVRDLLVLIDGIPITDADGFTRLDQIDLAAAERVEVVKGPASALYGNAAFGGVVNVITRRGRIGDPEYRVRLEAGELGFAKGLVSAAGGSASRRVAYALHLSQSRLDDFRQHNDTQTSRLNGTLEWFASDRASLQILLNMSEMRDEIPGTLNRRQFESDPSQVRPVFQLFDHRRDDDRYRLGAVLERQLSPQDQLEGRLFVLTRRLDHPIFQVIDQDALRFMGGLQYSRHFQNGRRGEHRLTLGFDGDREETDNRRFRNVFGERGEMLLRADQTVEHLGLYVQDEIAVTQNLSLTLGGRYDRIDFVEDDRLKSGGLDLSDRRTFERFSPKIGLLWQARSDLGIYVNLATAFQVPTKSEISATGGLAGFNQDLKPQVARHAEIGVRGTWRKRVRYEAALFRTEVDDEILPATRINDQTVFGNVGETRHDGAELGLEVLLGRIFLLGFGYGWSDNVFTDFGEFTGNILPGFPEHRGTIRLATRREGLNGHLSFERVGSMFLDDRNRDRQGPYSVLNAGLSYPWKRVSIFLNATNLTDERYAAWIAVNDRFGNFFAPAPGRAFTGGIDVRF